MNDLLGFVFTIALDELYKRSGMISSVKYVYVCTYELCDVPRIKAMF